MKQNKTHITLTIEEFESLRRAIDILAEVIDHCPFELNEVLDEKENAALAAAYKLLKKAEKHG